LDTERDDFLRKKLNRKETSYDEEGIFTSVALAEGGMKTFRIGGQDAVGGVQIGRRIKSTKI
jgi:hypothetical protein